MAVGLLDLPPELMLAVGAHLGPADLARLGRVCRAFSDLLAHHQGLWRKLFRARWPAHEAEVAAHMRETDLDWRRVCLYEWARDEWRAVAKGRWRHRRLDGHQGSVQAVQLLPRYVLSGALDGRVKVWDRQTGECKYTFAKHKGPVACLRYDGSSHMMASGGYDGTIQLYNLKGGVANPIPHNGKVLALELYDDHLVSGGSSGTIHTHHISTHKLISILPGHDGSVMSLSAYWPDRLLVSGGYDKTVKLWDLRIPSTWQSRSTTLVGHTAAVSSVSLHDKIAVTASWSSNGELFVWDIRMSGSTSLLTSLSNAAAGPMKSSYYDGMKLLSSGERESCVRVWDPRDWTCRAKWPHASPSLCLDSPSVSALVAGGRDYSISLWEKRPSREGEERRNDANNGSSRSGRGHKRKRPHKRGSY